MMINLQLMNSCEVGVYNELHIARRFKRAWFCYHLYDTFRIVYKWGYTMGTR